jgi:hypothetical protein
MAVQPPSWIEFKGQAHPEHFTGFSKSKTAAILDLLKPVKSPPWLNRFLPNLAGHRRWAINMTGMSFNFRTRSMMVEQPPSWIY